jgi:cytochrome c oxidase subunit IV
MKLSAPKAGLFYTSVVIFILGLIAALVTSFGLGSYAVWVVAIAFLLLAIGNFVKGA